MIYLNNTQDLEIRWQGEQIDNKKGRGTGVAIINPLNGDYKYQNFDTIEDKKVSVNFI